MMRQLLLAVTAGLLLAAAPAAAPGDRDRLQGAWRLDAVEINGQPVALEKLKSGDKVLVGTLTVAGDSYTFRLGDLRLALTFAVDPTKSPKAIDLTEAEGPQKGRTYHGIYKVEGDTYTICRNVEPGKDRPTEFATRPDSGLMLVVWKRAQP
jgi:RNA polymerase sigma-70 factor (ECF subfamily)